MNKNIKELKYFNEFIEQREKLKLSKLKLTKKENMMLYYGKML